MARKKKLKLTPHAPERFAERNRPLKRTHRQVIYLNDNEWAFLQAFCSRYGVKGRSSLFREATMAHILAQLDEDHPTLF